MPTLEARNSGKSGLRLPQSQQKKKRLENLSVKIADGDRSVHIEKKKKKKPSCQELRLAEVKSACKTQDQPTEASCPLSRRQNDKNKHSVRTGWKGDAS